MSNVVYCPSGYSYWCKYYISADHCCYNQEWDKWG